MMFRFVLSTVRFHILVLTTICSLINILWLKNLTTFYTIVSFAYNNNNK